MRVAAGLRRAVLTVTVTAALLGAMASPVRAATVGPPPATSISAGIRFTCAVVKGVGVRCWGDPFSDALGDGGGSNPQDVPLGVDWSDGATAVTSGPFQSSCLLAAQGRVKCWGRNDSGEVGDGTKNVAPEARAVVGLKGASTVAAGGGTSCAIVKGLVKCWGGNYGVTPASVSGISGATAIAVGPYHQCVVVGGPVKCWGYGGNGQLGNGGTSSSTSPVTVFGITNATAVAVSGSSSCALLSGGAVACWGAGGELGNGSTSASSFPVLVSGVSNAVSVSSGPYHTCVVLDDGGIKCWGSNNHSQLGNGGTTDSPSPVSVVGISNAKAVAEGLDHTCAIVGGAGDVKCWGANDSGQLGNESTDPSPTPVDVVGLGNSETVVMAHTVGISPLRNADNTRTTSFGQSLGTENTVRNDANYENYIEPGPIAINDSGNWTSNYSAYARDVTVSTTFGAFDMLSGRLKFDSAVASVHAFMKGTSGRAFTTGSSITNLVINGAAVTTFAGKTFAITDSSGNTIAQATFLKAQKGADVNYARASMVAVHIVFSKPVGQFVAGDVLEVARADGSVAINGLHV